MALVLIGSLFTPQGREVQALYGGLPNAFFLAFFAGAVALIFVPPNFFATLLANEIGEVDKRLFLAALTLVSILGCLAMAAVLNIFFKSMGGFNVLNDWRNLAVILANSGLLVLVALVFGARHS